MLHLTHDATLYIQELPLSYGAVQNKQVHTITDNRDATAGKGHKGDPSCLQVDSLLQLIASDTSRYVENHSIPLALLREDLSLSFTSLCLTRSDLNPQFHRQLYIPNHIPT